MNVKTYRDTIQDIFKIRRTIRAKKFLVETKVHARQNCLSSFNRGLSQF